MAEGASFKVGDRVPAIGDRLCPIFDRDIIGVVTAIDSQQIICKVVEGRENWTLPNIVFLPREGDKVWEFALETPPTFNTIEEADEWLSKPR